MEAATPPANVYEGNGQLSVATPLPGAHPSHIEVVVRPTEVGVTAGNKYSQEEQHYHLHEWLVGGWDLRVGLPKTVDPAAARATLNLGVLVITAPLSATGSGESRPAVREA
ncbi:MAG: Hsp20/alpha crystallin family protein [Candidatus Dormibacteraceae bacterium]